MAEQVEGIRADNVSAWLMGVVPGLRLPLTFTLIAGGHSNLTYRFDDANGESYVLRRPPLGHVLESAHDMGREHRIISALADTEVPVAPTFGLCTDTSVNDAPFYIMKFVDGLVLNDSVATGALTMPDRYALGLHVIDVLGKLHKIDPDTVGLGDLGRKEAYLARQLKRWTTGCASQSKPSPPMSLDGFT